MELICLHTTKCTHLVVSYFSLSVLLLEKSFVILDRLWFLGSHKMLVLGVRMPQRDGNLWGLLFAPQKKEMEITINRG
jgi:hypothetical protein